MTIGRLLSPRLPTGPRSVVPRVGPLSALVLAVASWTQPAPVRADVVVGVAVPRSGPYVTIGEQVLRGAHFAAQDSNARGGLDGEQIALDVQDDACDSNQAVAVANHYVQAGVRLVVGHVCSNASLAASEIYAANGIVMITAASVAAKLTDRNLPTIFRVCGRDDDQARLSAAVLAERFRDRKIAIVYDPSPTARGLAAATKDNLNRIGVNEALFTAFQPGDTDDAALSDRLKAAGIDVIYDGGSAQDMGRLVKIASDRGYRPQWFGTSSIATPEFAKIAGAASNGVLMTFYLDPSRKPEAQGVVAEVKAQGGDPDGSLIYGYAALQALVEAGNFAHSTDPRAIGKALHNERFDLVLGSVGFDGKGDVTAQGYVLYVWRDGSFTTAKTN